MLLRGVAAEAYPKFTEYLYYRFPKVLHSSKIVGYMAAHGSLDKSTFAYYLSPGCPPIIDIEGWEIYHCHVTSHWLAGPVVVESPPYITLWEPMIVRFENDPWDPRNMHTTSKGQKVPIVGTVLLHALVDYRLYTLRGVGDSWCPGGYEFEESVYGNIVKFHC